MISKSMSSYRNGNYLVRIDEEGNKTFIGLKAGEEFDPIFPDNIDIKLTDKCNVGCSFCYENSSSLGKHGNFSGLQAVLSSLPKVPIELAFGGGSLFTIETDKLRNFLWYLKEGRGHKIGATINFKDLINIPMCDWDRKILPCLDNIGISITDAILRLHGEQGDSDYVQKMLAADKLFERVISKDINVVLHLILGLFTKKEIEGILSSSFMARDTKHPRRILFLGYKTKGRGITYTQKPDSSWFEWFRKYTIQNILRFPKQGIANWNIAFDNLALEQLNLRAALTEKEWSDCYMGQETSHSIFIDAVTETFGPSSTSSIRVPWKDYNYSALEYFNSVKNKHDK